MSEAKRVPSVDFLGRCYDIVKIDPLDLASSASFKNAIDIDMNVADNVYTSPDGSFLLPRGVRPLPIYGTSWEAQSGVISSSHEFREEFKVAVEAEAGVDGGFEFSASASHKGIVESTQSRKQSFVYSRAYRPIIGLQLQLSDDNAPIAVTKELSNAVKKLPVGDFEAVADRYETFIGDFGTHFTKEIQLGGLMFQSVSGSSKRFLVSKQTEDEFRSKAATELDAIKGGVSADVARKTASTVDQEYSLKRGKLDYRGGDPGDRGGDGEPAGIDASWVTSLYEKPVPIKAKMEPLTSLFTRRFFPDEANIENKGMLLELATRDWVVAHGSATRPSAPLRYGEAVVLTLPWTDDTIQPGVLLPAPPPITGPGGGYQVGVEYPVAVAFPVNSQRKPVLDGELAAIRLESTDARRAGAAVLAGDTVRIRLLREAGKTYTYLGPDLKAVQNIGMAGSFTMIIQGDNPTAPDRLGDFLLETDRLLFMTGRVDSPGQFFGIDAGPRHLSLGSGGIAFSLKRCGDPEL